MKKLLLALCLLATCGCVTISNRVLDYEPISDPYQCTCESVVWCTFIMFPQVVAPDPFEFQWVNIVSAPIGACCFIIDVPLEAVCDTLCYPHDVYCIKIKQKTAEAAAP